VRHILKQNPVIVEDFAIEAVIFFAGNLIKCDWFGSRTLFVGNLQATILGRLGYIIQGTKVTCQRTGIWNRKIGESHVPIYDYCRFDLDSIVYHFECHSPPAWPVGFGCFPPFSKGEDKKFSLNIYIYFVEERSIGPLFYN
jgi:hypothetical protein